MKDISAVHTPDARNLYWLRTDLDTGETRPFAIDDLHRRLSQVVLHDRVPQDLSAQFETVRDLLLYSWFVYEFTKPAFLTMSTLVEAALKERLVSRHPNGRRKRPTLEQLFGMAISSGLLRDHMFEDLLPSHPERAVDTVPNGTTYVQTLSKAQRELRNSCAHGRPFLLDPLGVIELVEKQARIVNLLFG